MHETKLLYVKGLPWYVKDIQRCSLRLRWRLIDSDLEEKLSIFESHLAFGDQDVHAFTCDRDGQPPLCLGMQNVFFLRTPAIWVGESSGKIC